MAQKVVVDLIDDLDGSQATQTVKFGLDGVTFEIDLNDDHADELRDALARYIAAGRKTRGTRNPRPTTAPSSGKSASAGNNRERNREVRAWARAKGFEVAARGRIPEKILEAFNVKDQVTAPARRKPAAAAPRTPRKATAAAARRRQPRNKPAA
jgi:hypothetical protein